jgi:hypothetical protein
VEQAQLLPTTKHPHRQAKPPGGGRDNEAPIDWLMTSLLFVFPAIGGLLFGWGHCCSAQLLRF